MNGAKNARAAVGVIADGSASPMETIVTMLLCLPRSVGGYGLPLPIMNHRIEIPKTARTVSSKGFYYCDLYWPEWRMAVEYDSDMFHASSEGIASDSKRRNALEYMGIQVISVTRRQVLSLSEMDKVAHQLKKRMGKPRSSTMKDLRKRQSKLRSMLFERNA